MRILFLTAALILATANTQPTIQSLVDAASYDQAVAMAQQGAANGDGEAHDWLGYFYEHGMGVDADMSKAEQHYKVAAELGENHAKWRLGVLIDTGEIGGTLEEAVALFQSAANEEYLDGYVSLAVMQAMGRGTAQDYAASLSNYMKAARLGSAHGAQGVGVLLMNGQGVEKNPLEAAAWFLFAAARGNSAGEDNLRVALNQLEPQEMKTLVERANTIADELGFEVEIQFDESELSETPG